MASENDIGGKIGLDVTNFKAGITELNRNIRVIESGFKAAAASMGRWSDSEEGLQKRIESLNKVTDLQRQKVKNLTGEYEKIVAEKGANSKAAQDMEIRINKETASLNKNQLGLEKAKKELDEFGKETDKTTKDVDEFGDETDQATKKTNKFDGALGKLGKGMAKVGGAAGKAAIAGIAAVGVAATAAAVGAFKLASNVGQVADDLNTLSNKTGISTEQLQEWQYASRFIDVSVETMTGSMAKLTKNMDAARDGTKLSVEAFEKLGIEYKNQDGSLRDSKVVWKETIDALGEISNETDRDAVAMKLFGKSAMELNPLIKAGSAELEKLSAEAHEVGAVLGTEAIAEAQKFDDQMQKMQASMGGLKNTIGVAVMPAISMLVSSFSSAIPAIIDAVKTGDWTGASDAVMSIINGLLSKIMDAMPGLMTMAANIIGSLAGTLVAAIPQILPALITATLLLLNTLVNVLVDNGPLLITAGMNALMMLITGMVEALPSLMDAAFSMINTLVASLAENMPLLIESALGIVNTLIDTLLENGPLLITAGIDALMSLVDGIIEALPNLIESAIEVILTLANALLDRLPDLIKAGIELIVALALGLIKALPKLVDEIPKIIEAIFDAVISNLPIIIEAALQIIIALGAALISAIPKLIKSIPTIIKAIFDAFGDIEWGDIGRDLLGGIGEGIKGAVTGVINSVKETAEKIFSSVKGFFGIGSPSKLFEDEVGFQLGAGLAKGISKSAKQVNDAMRGLNKQIEVDGTLNTNITGSGFAGANSGAGVVMVNVPLSLDGQVITSATSRIQLGKNRTRSRALGVVPA